MYDIIIGIGENLIKHGWSVSFLGALFFLLLKQRPSKRWMKKHFPILKRWDEADVMNYEARQIRIEQDVRDIKAHLGVTECAASNVSLINTGKHSSRSSQEDGSYVRSAGALMLRVLTTILRGNRGMKRKLMSRKFLMAIISAALVIANDGLDLGLDQNTIVAFGSIVVAWIVGEAAVDAKRKQPEVYDASYTSREDSEGA